MSLLPLLVAAALRASAASSDIALIASDGVHLAATYSPAPEADAPALVLLPILGGKRSDWEPFSRLAESAGVTTLLLDPRGHGGSENPYGKPPEGWPKPHWDDVDLDVLAAVAWLEARGVPPGRIVVGGASIGGSLALRRAACDRSLAGAALVSAGDNPARVPASEFLDAYGKRGIFIASAADDPVFDAVADNLVKRARGPVERLRLPSGGHGTAILADSDSGLALSRALLVWVRRVAGRAP
ncbi:MAG: alpha/beta fold hydrolase [Elusimicrobia bacterium]|nr:alpha/beta fold hydrolase [Elusimicrobiota bacterium]